MGRSMKGVVKQEEVVWREQFRFARVGTQQCACIGSANARHHIHLLLVACLFFSFFFFFQLSAPTRVSRTPSLLGRSSDLRSKISDFNMVILKIHQASPVHSPSI